VDLETGETDILDFLGKRDKVHIPAGAPEDGDYSVESGTLDGVRFTRMAWSADNFGFGTRHYACYVSYSNGLKTFLFFSHSGEHARELSAIAMSFQRGSANAILPAVGTAANDFETDDMIPRYSPEQLSTVTHAETRFREIHGRDPTEEELEEFNRPRALNE